MNAVVENGVVVEPDPIEKLKLSVSASRLNCWLQCRLKFFFRYVLKISKPKTPALHYGSVLHLVLQQWNLARWRKQRFDLAKLKLVFDAGWADQGQIDWEGEELEQKTSAWSVLEKYFTDTPIKADEMPEAVEVPAEADLSSHGLPVLIGVLDLVRRGGRIVDFKSAGKTPDNNTALHQNGLQLNCYSILYRESTGKREAGRELHHLIKTSRCCHIQTGSGRRGVSRSRCCRCARACRQRCSDWAKCPSFCRLIIAAPPRIKSAVKVNGISIRSFCRWSRITD